MIYTLTLNPAVDREYTVAEIAFDTVLRAGTVRVDAGGKGFNVCRMLANLDTASVALGFVGGTAGDLLQSRLESGGITTDFIRVDQETRTNVSVVTPEGGHYLKVNEPGPTITPDQLQRLREQVGRLAREGDWWVLAGSLPPGVPPSIYADLIEIIQPAGGRVILDASGEALRLGCAAGPYLVKPNAVEAAQITGREEETLSGLAVAAREIQAVGAANVVMSLGEDGALAAGKEQVTHLRTPLIEEKNPIGAGDAMVGGLVWGLAGGRSLLESARWGVACGAAAAALEGTAFGRREQIELLFEETGVEAADVTG